MRYVLTYVKGYGPNRTPRTWWRISDHAKAGCPKVATAYNYTVALLIQGALKNASGADSPNSSVVKNLQAALTKACDERDKARLQRDDVMRTLEFVSTDRDEWKARATRDDASPANAADRQILLAFARHINRALGVAQS